jgi:hypothetical protein
MAMAISSTSRSWRNSRETPPDAFRFQLRNDSNQRAPRGMLDLQRDAFNNTPIANINTPPGKHNGIIVRV